MEVQLEKLSLDTKPSEEMEEVKKIPRHCAFCLIPLAEKDVKNCAKCHRRAYCGQECQKKDWKSKKISRATGVAEGQGHCDWCELPVCEEDLDWYVKEGGKGVVAKRLILKGERILVGNAAQYKERTGKSGDGEGMLFNHACDANSDMNHGVDFNVQIITAEKDIQPGTEITFNYVGFGDKFTEIAEAAGGRLTFEAKPFENAREVLKSKYGIICPEDCFCYDKHFERVISRRIETIHAIQTSQLTGPDAVTILQMIVNPIPELDEADVRWRRVQKAQMICKMMEIMRDTKDHLNFLNPLTPYYVKEANDIFKSIFHPKTPRSKLERWVDWIED